MIVGDRPFALVDTAPSARTAWTLFAACVALEVLIVDSGKGVSLLLDVTIVKGPDFGPAPSRKSISLPA